MICDNNAKRLVNEIQMRLTSAFINNRLPETIDRMPLEMRPLGTAVSRCCVYKSRALIKYRAMAALGFGTEDETDELVPLSEYARRALSRREVDTRILSVITPACSGCPQTQFYVSDACRGCMAHPCQLNCPKQCISISNHRAHIATEECVNCGKCQKVCPFHAIIRVSVPCEEACPVNALSRDEQNKVTIDFNKCIYCGKCVSSCPFGAIVERSQLIDVLQALRSGKRIYALIAPAIIGQWDGGIEWITDALGKLGFHAVKEVAHGADAVAKLEAREFLERRRHGLPFMTSSCCPAYVQAAKKVIPEIGPFVSATPSPLQLVARAAKENDPEAIAVFIGPCIAKRREAMDDGAVDYYLTFSELDSMLAAGNLETEVTGVTSDAPACREGRGFPLTGGVASAVTAHLPRGQEAKVISISGLNRAALMQLQSYATGNCPAQLVEVMNCEGGCINGPAVVAPPAQAKSRIENVLKQSKPAYAIIGSEESK